MHLSRIFLLSLALCLTPPAAVGQPATAGIAGNVVDAKTLKPLSNALVIARDRSALSTRRTSRSAPDGSFSLSNLAAGTYFLCVKPAAEGYLDPCDWGRKPSTLILAAGQKSTANLVAVPIGSVVKIRIQDTAQILFQKTAAGFLPDLTVGTFDANGLFHPARVGNRDRRGLDLQLTVPLDTRLSLTVMSRAATLADAKGAALPTAGLQTPFLHATGDQNPPGFTYTVTGIRP